MKKSKRSSPFKFAYSSNYMSNRCIKRPHRLVVRTSRCGRDNPGSTPGVDMFFEALWHCDFLILKTQSNIAGLLNCSPFSSLCLLCDSPLGFSGLLLSLFHARFRCMRRLFVWAFSVRTVASSSRFFSSRHLLVSLVLSRIPCRYSVRLFYRFAIPFSILISISISISIFIFL